MPSRHSRPVIETVLDKRSEPRIPFAAIVAAGLIAPGETLTDEKKRHSAIVRAEGAISIGPVTGSIHKIGALVQGLPACNGWTFWHCEREGRFQPIDSLRAVVREACARRRNRFASSPIARHRDFIYVTCASDKFLRSDKPYVTCAEEN